jgi:solute carrier family 25 carnitine/acylcarnitine transporter 20/29
MVLIMRFEGGFFALFKGYTPTLLREIPGNAAYFGTYTLVKEQLAAAQGLLNTSQLGAGSLMLAGGLAGAAFWMPTIPVDTIKTRMQLDSPYNPKYRGIVDCARKLIQSEGMGSLFRGWQPCIARSVPANAALFMTYEVTHKLLENLVH